MDMRAKTKVKNAEQEGLDGQIRVCDVEKYYGTKIILQRQ